MNKIIIDSNVIASLSLGETKEVEQSLKRYLMIYDEILIPDITYEELKNNAKYRGIGENTKKIINSIPHKSIDIPRELSSIHFDKVKDYREERGYYKAEKLIAHDALIVNYALDKSHDIYTLDRFLLGFIDKYKSDENTTFTVDFPIDDDKLRELNFDESKKYGDLFRDTYRDLLNQAKELNIEKSKIESEKEQIIKKKNQIVSELQNEINKQSEFIKELKSIARPNTGFSVAFTAAELVLGFWPIPSVTTPFTHFIQSRKYKDVIKKHS